ncbi:MAG: thioredoxin domain-containing protein, partial [Ferruginibacter sp.]
TPVGYTKEKKDKSLEMKNQNYFNPDALESKTLSLVQFKSEWNGACQLLSMICSDLAKSYKGIVNFYTIDFEMEKALNQAYGVREVPTILLFKNGKVIDHAIGLIPKQLLITKIENALSYSANA